MRYQHPVRGTFWSRPNRFIALVEVEGQTQRCHVKNTGRCKELLLPGATVILDRAENPARSTPYDVVAVYKGATLINMDSAAPNKAFGEYLASGAFLPGLTRIKPESPYGDSRLDFYAETASQKILIEVKGCTLEEEGVALFPDAPTERGVKHLRELAAAAAAGYQAHVVIVIQMKGCHVFRANRKTHPAFADALREAAAAGVSITALDCVVTEDGMRMDAPVPVELV